MIGPDYEAVVDVRGERDCNWGREVTWILKTGCVRHGNDGTFRGTGATLTRANRATTLRTESFSEAQPKKKKKKRSRLRN